MSGELADCATPCSVEWPTHKLVWNRRGPPTPPGHTPASMCGPTAIAQIAAATSSDMFCQMAERPLHSRFFRAAGQDFPSRSHSRLRRCQAAAAELFQQLYLGRVLCTRSHESSLIRIRRLLLEAGAFSLRLFLRLCPSFRVGGLL